MLFWLLMDRIWGKLWDKDGDTAQRERAPSFVCFESHRSGWLAAPLAHPQPDSLRGDLNFLP
jgi:hypothetical protein